MSPREEFEEALVNAQFPKAWGYGSRMDTVFVGRAKVMALYDRAVADARREAFEEAAGECDTLHVESPNISAHWCGVRIRRLAALQGSEEGL